MKRNAQISLEKFLIGIVVMSMVATGLGVFVSDLSGRYGTEMTPEFQNTFNRFNETYDLSEDVAEDIKSASAVEEDDWDFGDTIKASLNAVKTVFVSGIPTAFAMVTNIGDFIPLPSWITRGIQTILIIVLAFALVYLYFRYKNPG